MKPTHWKCYRCRKMKKLPEEIERADLRAVCRECKRAGLNGDAPEADAAQEQVVYVHRRGIVRRHGRDNRDID